MTEEQARQIMEGGVALISHVLTAPSALSKIIRVEPAQSRQKGRHARE